MNSTFIRTALAIHSQVLREYRRDSGKESMVEAILEDIAERFSAKMGVLDLIAQDLGSGRDLAVKQVDEKIRQAFFEALKPYSKGFDWQEAFQRFKEGYQPTFFSLLT